MSTFSAVVNGQLVAVAPANAIVAPGAGQPVISGGAYASNLQGMSNQGGATNVPMSPQAQVTASTGAATSPAGTISGLTGNVWSLPFWQNPLALTILMLIVAYLILRYVHWRPS
jgi:hypothetical protein